MIGSKESNFILISSLQLIQLADAINMLQNEIMRTGFHNPNKSWNNVMVF